MNLHEHINNCLIVLTSSPSHFLQRLNHLLQIEPYRTSNISPTTIDKCYQLIKLMPMIGGGQFVCLFVCFLNSTTNKNTSISISHTTTETNVTYGSTPLFLLSSSLFLATPSAFRTVLFLNALSGSLPLVSTQSILQQI